jgi:hypothetical protein
MDWEQLILQALITRNAQARAERSVEETRRQLTARIERNQRKFDAIQEQRILQANNPREFERWALEDARHRSAYKYGLEREKAKRESWQKYLLIIPLAALLFFTIMIHISDTHSKRDARMKEEKDLQEIRESKLQDEMREKARIENHLRIAEEKQNLLAIEEKRKRAAEIAEREEARALSELRNRQNQEHRRKELVEQMARNAIIEKCYPGAKIYCSDELKVDADSYFGTVPKNSELIVVKRKLENTVIVRYLPPFSNRDVELEIDISHICIEVSPE